MKLEDAQRQYDNRIPEEKEIPTCEGKCSDLGTCKGEVRRYRVVGPAGMEWGDWWYCDTAAKSDRQMGFAVLEEVEDE